MSTIACVGVGVIGAGWAAAFARAGHTVRLYDADASVLGTAAARIGDILDNLNAGASRAHLSVVDDLAQAINDCDHVQESIVEDLESKRILFARLDSLTTAGTTLGSSTSEFAGSRFMNVERAPERCLVVHPTNPPYLVPLVELCPTESTAPSVINRTETLLRECGLSPVRIHREVAGFVLNRLQAAVIAESLHLVAEGVISAMDLDRVMADGLGRRWAFMGPFLTGHLNAKAGYRQYMRQYGAGYRREMADLKPNYPWTLEHIDQIAGELERTVPVDQLPAAQRWRDRMLAAVHDAVNTGYVLESQTPSPHGGN